MTETTDRTDTSDTSDKTAQPFAAIGALDALSQDEDEPGFEAVQGFLERFGYVRTDVISDGQLDDPTSEALERYQRFHGLEPTGEFDASTRAQMTTHRCGLPDLNGGLFFSTRCAWPHPSLTFAFEDGTSDVAGDAELQAVRNAVATWAAAVRITLTETDRTQSPDVAIDWRPAEDPDRSMVGGVLAHADFPPGCSVVTNALPKPVHFDDSEHQWAVGAVAGGFDVETVALHELGHILGLQHSDVAGSVMFPSIGANTVKRALTADDLAGIRSLYPAVLPSNGAFTIRQQRTDRFLDAHEIAANDFRLVTRPAQGNDTQIWDVGFVGSVFVIRQKSNGRYLDAHESSGNDFRVVTRAAEANASQRWVEVRQSDGSSTFRQLSTGRFLDAHEVEDQDFNAVTRTAQGNDTQRWLLTHAGPNTFAVRQKSNGRFLDAHESAGNDFRVVTRTNQNNDTQRWILCSAGIVCTLRQRSNGRFVDAHEHSGLDFGVVTRTAQANDTQRWVLLPAPGGTFTIQQLSGRRFVDAHESAGNDFAVVTRPAENNNSQRWVFTGV